MRWVTVGSDYTYRPAKAAGDERRNLNMRVLTIASTALYFCFASWCIEPGFADEAKTKLPSTSAGTRLLSLGDAQIKMLVDQNMLPDGEIEIGMLSLPAGFASSGVHPHGSLEIFYVIEGNLIHRLNGETHILKPGMVGIARIGDTIDHGVDGDVPVKALVIWVSGGEVDRLVEGGFTSTPLD